MTMNPYQHWLQSSKSNSFKGMYREMEGIAKVHLGMDELPFPLSAIEHPPGNKSCPDIAALLLRCRRIQMGDNSEALVIKLIESLKKNPPKKSFENPKVPDSEMTKDEFCQMSHIFSFGIDLPGSRYNPEGNLQYFSSVFIDMFFGNYTKYKEHIKSLPNEELDLALKQREGYCQFSPVFAPILGLALANIDDNPNLTSIDRQKIKELFNGKSEKKYGKILEDLLELGADPNAHGINGYTPLHHVLKYNCIEMTLALLNHGADPNLESRDERRPLTIIIRDPTNILTIYIIDILVKNKARLTKKDDINKLRSIVENIGDVEAVVRVREAMPRDRYECERCLKISKKICTGCRLVFYCSPACQKMDWKFHKGSCGQKKQVAVVD